MTSKELMLSTLEFRNTTGRAPRQLWSLPWAQLHEKEGFDRICRDFHWDMQGVEAIYKEAPAVQRGDPYVPGDSYDAWGCHFTNIHPGVHGEVKDPLVTDDDWKDISRVHFPEEWLSFDVEQVNAACAGSTDFIVGGCCPRPFEQLQFIRGSENLYMDLIEQPKGFLEFVERMHDFYCRLMKKWAQTDVDALSFMDDWGAQRSLLINPKLWREFFKPMYRDYIDIAHAAGKKVGMHSDGYTLDIIPDLIELGLDYFNTQIFCIGIDKLAQFKGKITFHGEICRQNLLPNGSVQDIRNAVKEVYDTLWDNGGCIAQCEFGPGSKPENVYAVFQTWDELTGGR